jgi:excisionase family DNA binding protein
LHAKLFMVKFFIESSLMESENKGEWYTTGEAAKVLGVSFRTVKRWIYSGRISAVRTIGGHYRISREEIERLQFTVKDQFTLDIISLIEQKKVVYFREVQLNLEDKYRHYETRDKLRWLVAQGRLGTSYESKRRWYFSVDSSWEAVKNVAEEKLKLISFFENYERKFELDGVRYQDYSEYIVEQAMIRAGYTVVAKDSYYFNGISCILQTGPGRPPDLDFIAKLPDGDYVGVQVKNRVEYPKSSDVNIFIELCRMLHLRPLLVARQAHPMTFDVVSRLKGRVVIFKQILLKPGFPRETLEALRQQIGIPVAVYKWPPDYLIRGLIDAAEAMSKL